MGAGTRHAELRHPYTRTNRAGRGIFGRSPTRAYGGRRNLVCRFQPATPGRQQQRRRPRTPRAGLRAERMAAHPKSVKEGLNWSGLPPFCKKSGSIAQRLPCRKTPFCRVDIHNGGILIDTEATQHPGDILHEAGHIAVVRRRSAPPFPAMSEKQIRMQWATRSPPFFGPTLLCAPSGCQRKPCSTKTATRGKVTDTSKLQIRKLHWPAIARNGWACAPARPKQMPRVWRLSGHDFLASGLRNRPLAIR